MLDFCKNNDIIFEKRRLLISGKKVKKILLATPLLQWYLSHHCEISKIYQIIEFQPKCSFTSFIDTVTKFRILGDKHPDKAIVGDTYKLLSNSSYGSILINKSKHCNINYMKNRHKIMNKVNSLNFKNLDKINNDLYEVETYKKKIVMDNPIQIGFFILQYAKLRMLEFYYDCLSTYLNPKSFDLCETDSDSIYMAISTENLDDSIRDECKDQYFKEIFNSCSDKAKPKWFPRRCCDKHKALDRRETGIFKLEFLGRKMISLCSKSYIIEDENGKQKVSCKGVSKRRLEDPMKNFEEALGNKTVKLATNIGFRSKNNTIYTYSQDKIGFNYFYCKREVLSDGVSTIPLNLTLSPWNEEIELVEQVQHPLSNLFPIKIFHEGITFNSSEHLFHYQLAMHYNRVEISDKILSTPDPVDFFLHFSFFSFFTF